MNQQERMAGEWSFPIIQREVEEGVVVVVVELMTQNVMNVVNLVILLESVARALVRGD